MASGKTKSGRGEGEYTATLYPGPKGNLVFNAATIWWADGLSEPPGYVRPERLHDAEGPRPARAEDHRELAGPVPGGVSSGVETTREIEFRKEGRDDDPRLGWRSLFAVAALALVPGCLEFKKQTVLLKFDEKSDEITILSVYEGF